MKNMSISPWLCIIILFTILAGCNSASTGTTSDNPTIHSLDKVMYCSLISSEGELILQYEERLYAVITDNPNGEDLVEFVPPLGPDSEYTLDHRSVSFIREHEDKKLPYYCIKGKVYCPLTDAMGFLDMALDFEEEYLIFKPAANITEWYVLASTDPNVSPDTIMDHFAEFLTLYDRSKLWPGD